MSRTPPDSRSETPRSRRAKPGQTELFGSVGDGPDFSFETAAGSPEQLVAGADEAGRGPLAGPVVAAAVILDPQNIPPGLNDSKKLTSCKRDALFELILANADVSIASSGPARIDRTNILRASLDAMRRAINTLPSRPHSALIDGRDVPPGLCCRAQAVIKGDARSLSIAAASIVAKVMRDRMMRQSAKLFPVFGFERHAGYGTAEHRKALAEHGPCPLHRMSFKPLREDV
ncbi:ribonuclease HII [Hoeflea prorocentri]|uniref:Ribonuclease HII n=1 Tax=Hoeflea prorocentri TaxID=1922333 RepID=A0A9X3UJ32_9HYPH|nr:ribonuclease HII [Hoeflea prorocentri]MCY6381715.1 ribonuclease HII [Hoeflea prorocentri]MDA5399515.1 ribonuclease HII [Hoeflea prorocentri]